jgi:hypothetical protein
VGFRGRGIGDAGRGTSDRLEAQMIERIGNAALLGLVLCWLVLAGWKGWL